MSALDFLPLLVPGIALGVWLFFVAKKVLLKHRGMAWPLAVARVENFEVAQFNRDIFRVTLYYSYSAQGHYYSGAFARTLPSRDAADACGSDWQDRQIMVHYNPVQPSESLFLVRTGLKTVDWE